jgi:hypothetical protein
MSTSATARASTSAERSPQYSINPATARSRQVRKLASSSAASAWDNARGRRRGSRSRSDERVFGLRTVCASIPLRSPGTRQRASRPFGTGLVRSGSRIAANVNKPEIAASRRLIVVAAY